MGLGQVSCRTKDACCASRLHHARFHVKVAACEFGIFRSRVFLAAWRWFQPLTTANGHALKHAQSGWLVAMPCLVGCVSYIPLVRMDTALHKN